jgi:hypothetical protein
VAIHYRDHCLVFREWKAASKPLSEGRGPVECTLGLRQ